MKKIFKQTALALTLLCSAQAADIQRNVAVTLSNASGNITLDSHRDPSSVAHKKELTQIFDLIRTESGAIRFNHPHPFNICSAKFYPTQPVSVSLTDKGVIHPTSTKYNIVGWRAKKFQYGTIEPSKTFTEFMLKNNYNHAVAAIIGYLKRVETSASISFTHDALKGPEAERYGTYAHLDTLFLNYVINYLAPEPVAIIQFELESLEEFKNSEASFLLVAN